MGDDRGVTSDTKAAAKLRLAEALRANLRRRKAVKERPEDRMPDRQPKPAGEREG